MYTFFNYANKIAVGEHFVNNNGKVYVIIAIDEKKDKILFMNGGCYVGAWGVNPGKGEWDGGNYFLDNFEAATNWFLN